MYRYVKRLLGRESGEVITECRRCGSNRADRNTPCPDCGNTTIAAYRL